MSGRNDEELAMVALFVLLVIVVGIVLAIGSIL